MMNKEFNNRPHPAAPCFDPTWRDDVFDIQAVEIPLALPESTPRNNRVWIDVRPVRYEMILERQHTYDPYRLVTTVLKPSDMAGYYTVKDGHGQIIPADDPTISVIFPPKAWMSDSGEERCMMFAAAKLAKGHVLVGGLGLGVYPQFALALHRPVESLTIIERDSEIIDFVTRAWLHRFPEHAQKVTIIEGTIEEYLAHTEQTFDTIYLDTWEDADPRFLAHINHLLALASRCCSPDGTIRCWGYAKMIETFTETMKSLTEKAFPWHNFHLDPVLQAYIDWLDTQGEDVPESAIARAAVTNALTTQQPIDTYDRHRCFTAFGTSLTDAHRNMALSRKG